ncbi:MAG: NifU family protein [Dehalococcoidia bacterium]|jgi:Fe/S biogenesis protein NfuA|nr:MAG: Fe/S biogenesis protein NfuA [Chloroflexota bacterium]|tara:strand:- start:20153 stop:20761 length:609 start_codon:yes stop_codon:yes gene_type:complete
MNNNQSDNVEVFLAKAVADKLISAANNFPEPVAGVQLSINGRKDGAFDHKLSLIDKGTENPLDIVQEINETLNLYIEIKNAEYLHGLKIDFDETNNSSNGFIFNNPNPIWKEPIAIKLQKFFDEQVNPSIASHGGMINLIDIKGSSAYVEMSGGCQGCGMASVTLKQGVEVMVQEAIPEITELIDSTDHSSGENPYFASEKK